MDTASSPVPPRLTSDTACSPKKHSIIFIEDNSTVRLLLRYIIDQRSDITLLEAENGKQGLEMVRQHRPELILLDIHLPDMDGFMVFQHLQDAPDTAHIPVIALSGSAAPMDIQRGLTAGFKKFLPKPIDIKELHEALNEMLVP